MFLLVLLGLLFLFFLREFWSSQKKLPAVFIEKNFAILRLGKKVFTFGKNRSDNVKMTLRAITPYFSSQTFALEDISEKTNLTSKKISITRISSNLIKIIWQDQSIILVSDEIMSEEKEKIGQTPISLGADLWILQKNYYPKFLKIPKTAIISLATKTSKKIIEFARMNQTPLISAEETGGAVLEFNGQWNLKTR